jgi:glucans biosynthesis protein
MFWYGQAEHAKAVDWRPQIHDSDGLAVWTGAGERLWRPLNNPPRVMANAFLDDDPKGFGLMQRDRRFEDYEDDGVFYNRRPSAWVEPMDAWGHGSVELVEIPTAGETDDNIVAFWTPAQAVTPGAETVVSYRLHWCDAEPQPVGAARVIATRTGLAGRPGRAPRPGARKFVVDFAGGRLAELSDQSGVEAVVDASPRQALEPAAYRVVGTDNWRLTVDVVLAPGATVNLRAYLKLQGAALTETWIYQAFG